MGIDKETVKRLFPNLAKELETGENKIAVDSVRTYDATNKGFARYIPDVVGFIRRCDTTEEAEEIITYLEGRGEIEPQYAAKLRAQLREKGVRSFGAKKESGYYLKHGEI